MPHIVGALRWTLRLSVLTSVATCAAAYSAAETGWSDIIARADAAMAAVSTMQGRFVQVAPDGVISGGSYYLRRPGRVRFEYDAPSGLLVVADGATVAVTDNRLKSFDRYPLSSTVLGVFLDTEARLSEHGRILDVRTGDDRHYIRIGDRDGVLDQRMVLEFSSADFALLGWSIVDGIGQRTRVALRDNVLDKPLSARLFRILDPDEDRDRRR